MNYENNKISDLKITYIGGGSRGWAWRLMADLALEPALSGTVTLYDIDNTAAKNNEIIGNRLSQRGDTVGKWTYQTADSLQDALKGTDFVIISILPGTFDEMAVDVHTPEELGIYQSVGDTAGPGGLVRALRTLPMYVEIANAIKSYSPDAWVINYTNPMSLCVKILYKIFPGIKAFGCCHEVFGTQKTLKNICEAQLGIEGINREDIHVNVLGINHFTWFDKASYKGIDLFPVYQDFINTNHNEGIKDGDANWMNASFHSKNQVKFDLFRRFGWIAAAGDRHLVEFMPGAEYLKDIETVNDWGFKLTTVDWRKEELQKRLDKSQRLVSGEKEVELKPSGEEGVKLIKALCGLDRVVSNVNIPNYALQISNLDKNAIVETNAVFSKDSIQPIYAGEVKEDILMLLLPHLRNHEIIMEAALTCDFSLALEAFMKEPLVDGRCTKEEGTLLLRKMIEGTLSYLPENWKK
jgi:alpha-galactosidase